MNFLMQFINYYLVFQVNLKDVSIYLNTQFYVYIYIYMY